MKQNLFGGTCALLLTIGAITFLWGGSQHPLTDSSLGPLGTAEYFRAFARHVAGNAGWQEIHTGILAGPILWALGAVGLRARFSSEANADWSTLGLLALGLGALAWSIVFVLDGFIAPLQAAAIMEADSSVDAVHAFRVNQEIVIRLGLVSWLLIGAGIASLFGAALASSVKTKLVRLILVPSGIAVGLWPLVAWVGGAFRPGPFTSGLWTATAIATASWFLVAAVALIRKQPTQAA